jgi:hypothetical protein
MAAVNTFNALISDLSTPLALFGVVGLLSSVPYGSFFGDLSLGTKTQYFGLYSHKWARWTGSAVAPMQYEPPRFAGQFSLWHNPRSYFAMMAQGLYPLYPLLFGKSTEKFYGPLGAFSLWPFVFSIAYDAPLYGLPFLAVLAVAMLYFGLVDKN